MFSPHFLKIKTSNLESGKIGLDTRAGNIRPEPEPNTRVRNIIPRAQAGYPSQRIRVRVRAQESEFPNLSPNPIVKAWCTWNTAFFDKQGKARKRPLKIPEKKQKTKSNQSMKPKKKKKKVSVKKNSNAKPKPPSEKKVTRRKSMHLKPGKKWE